MRIDHIEIQNFKRFDSWSTDLHPQFTLLIGNNGTGKTTILDALAVASAIWMVDCPDFSISVNSGRGIYPNEIKTTPTLEGDRLLFRTAIDGASIKAMGKIGDFNDLEWKRQVRPNGKKTTNADARRTLEIIKNLYKHDADGQKYTFPILAYYGAGRAWLPSRSRSKPKSEGKQNASRWAAFYDCLSERIRVTEINEWFRKEAIEKGNRNGKSRPGYEIVKWAILRCFPDAEEITFNTSIEGCVIHSKNGGMQPFSYMSAGQRMMLYLVADIAIKAVTQNNYLVPADELQPEDRLIPRVLAQTPGVILIDELDVHLHPSWQRRVYKDLTETFPSLQFVCTTHSPQIIGEVKTECIRVIGDNDAWIPERGFGLDSNQVLEEIMDGKSQNDDVAKQVEAASVLIDAEKLTEARDAIEKLNSVLGENHPELIRLNSLISFLEP